MKEILDKVLNYKHFGNIVIIVVAVILIVVGYLVYVEYNQKQDISLNPVDVYENEENQNTDIVLDNNNTEVKDEPVVEEKPIEPVVVGDVKIPEKLAVITKGKNVGDAYRKDVSANGFEEMKTFLDSKEKLEITADTVVSLSLADAEDNFKTSIKDVNAKVYNKDGEILFETKITPIYDKMTVAVDELTDSEVYYVVFTVKSNDTAFEYIFKF